MALWRDKGRGGKWRYHFQLRGERYTGSGYDTKALARTAREEHREKVRSTPLPDPVMAIPTAMGFKTAANLYLYQAIKRFPPKTYKHKVYVFRLFLAYTKRFLPYPDPDDEAGMRVEAIEPEHILSYLNTRPSANNFNVHRKELSSLFTFCIKTLRIISYNPCWGVEKMPYTPARKVIPTQEEVLKILAAADPEESDLLHTIFHTVARVDEILRLAWVDVNFDSRVVTKWTRKRRGGSYEAIDIAMNAELYNILMRRWKNREQDKWVFYNKQTDSRYNSRPKLMASLCKRAGIKPIGRSKRKISRGKNKGQYEEFDLYYGFHPLRHFVSSYLKNMEKVETKVLQKLLGHKDERTTEIYLHSVAESQRAAIDALAKGLPAPKNTKPRTAPAHKRKGILLKPAQVLDFTGRGGRI